MVYPDGSSDKRTLERIDLSDPKLDENYGRGFGEYFIGKKIGTSLQEATFPMEIGTSVYFDSSINYITRGEENALVVDAHFPADYSQKALRCLDVKFDVFIDHINVYEAPEYNEQFITEVLKLTAESLADYPGATLLEKHRASIKKELEAENESIRRSLIEEAMWEHYYDKAKIKELPESEVEAAYNEICYELEYLYEYQYKYYYKTFDAFACAKYGIVEGGNWSAIALKEAKDIVSEKLIFFYIIRREKLVPPADEFEKLYNEVVSEKVDDYIESEGLEDTVSKLTGEEKEKKLSEIRETVIKGYGKYYLEQEVYYGYSYDKLVNLANVVEK